VTVACLPLENNSWIKPCSRSCGMTTAVTRAPGSPAGHKLAIGPEGLPGELYQSRRSREKIFTSSHLSSRVAEEALPTMATSGVRRSSFVALRVRFKLSFNCVDFRLM